MSWADFDANSALERDLLLRALPLVATASTGDSRAIFDVAADAVHVSVNLSETIGATPEKCIELLAIRPLLFGAAWKVLDLLIEEALVQAGKSPDQARGFSIDRKRQHARAGDGCPAIFPAKPWEAIARTYDATAVLRDSVVHRKVFTDSNQALVGHDRNGGRLRPLTVVEQEAFARTALRASDILVRQISDHRAEADLSCQLRRLSGLHRVAMASTNEIQAVPELTVVLDMSSDNPAIYPLDVPRLRSRQPFRNLGFIDLILEFRDRSGQVLRGRLEDAPDVVVDINPDAPPPWLS